MKISRSGRGNESRIIGLVVSSTTLNCHLPCVQTGCIFTGRDKVARRVDENDVGENRAVARLTIFEKPTDYDAFLQVLVETWQIIPLPIFATAAKGNQSAGMWNAMLCEPNWCGELRTGVGVVCIGGIPAGICYRHGRCDGQQAYWNMSILLRSTRNFGDQQNKTDHLQHVRRTSSPSSQHMRRTRSPSYW